jgi:hypothetical protein
MATTESYLKPPTLIETIYNIGRSAISSNIPNILRRSSNSEVDNVTSRMLSKIESYTCASHDLSIYHGALVSAEFASPHATGLRMTDPLVLYPALEMVIKRHSSLACCIHGQNTDYPKLVMVETIDLEKQTKIFQSPISEFERVKLYEQYVSNKFEDIETVCPWRVIISPIESENLKSHDSRKLSDASERTLFDDGITKWEVAFYFHHSISDGVGGRVFITSLFEALNEIFSNNATSNYYYSADLSNNGKEFSPISSIVTIPKGSLSLPLPLESLLKMPLSLGFLCKNAAAEFGFMNPRKNCWTGPPLPDAHLPAPHHMNTRLKRAKISAEQMCKLYQACRLQDTSITCLIAALLLSAVSKSIPLGHRKTEAGDCGGLDKLGRPYQKLSFALARNLRPLADPALGVDVDSIGDYACSHDMTIHRRMLENGDDWLWETARTIKSKLKTEISRGDQDLNPGLLRYAHSIRQYFLQKTGRARLHTFELSSIVAAKPSTRNNESWSISNLGFVQSASSEGGPISLSTISFKGEGLMLGFSWGEGNLPEDMIESIVKILLESVDRLCK